MAEAAERGSAGSVTLLLQTLLVPLALAASASTLILRGGTHVAWSPPFDGLASAYVPALRRMGFGVAVELTRWGWYPVGGGEMVCKIGGQKPAASSGAWPRPFDAITRGMLRRISGRAVAANLPAHIPQRMADRVHGQLAGLGAAIDIEPQCVTAACAGAGIFLSAEYEALAASFSAYGRLGKPSEAVADEAVAALREHHASEAAVELHLADQLLLPVAAGPSVFTVAHPTPHLLTNAWVIEAFGAAKIRVEGGAPSRVRVEPRSMTHFK